MKPLLVLAAIVSLWAAWAFASSLWQARRLRRLAARRTGSGISTFVRALEEDGVDEQVVRTVYAQLQAALGSAAADFPVHPGDELIETLGLDQGELDQLLEEAAERSGKSLEHSSANPHSGSLRTVSDLVRFLSAQPPR